MLLMKLFTVVTQYMQFVMNADTDCAIRSSGAYSSINTAYHSLTCTQNQTERSTSDVLHIMNISH